MTFSDPRAPTLTCSAASFNLSSDSSIVIFDVFASISVSPSSPSKTSSSPSSGASARDWSDATLLLADGFCGSINLGILPQVKCSAMDDLPLILSLENHLSPAQQRVSFFLFPASTFPVNLTWLLPGNGCHFSWCPWRIISLTWAGRAWVSQVTLGFKTEGFA